jgi:hypothetical protein
MGKQGLLPSTPQPSTLEGGTLTSRDKAERDSNPSVRSKQSTTANPPSSSNGAVSALKGLFNGRPISRQLSASKTSIGTLSQPSTITQPPTQPHDGDAGGSIAQSEESGQATRHDTFVRTFRPTSPSVTGHVTVLSPPLSPSHSLATEESTSLNPASPTLGSHPPVSAARHYLSGSSGTSSRKLAHSNSFSIDWDAIDGSQMVGTSEKRMSSASMALTPPPRNRRPWTTSTIPPPGSGGKFDWSTKEREKKSSTGIAVVNWDLTPPTEQTNQPLDANGSPMIEPEREGSTAEGTPDDVSLRETNGDDDITAKLQDDISRTNNFPTPIPHIPSPIVTPAALLHSSASSFAGGASNHNQSNRHSIHSGRNSVLSERSPRPPSHVSLASYDTDPQQPPSIQNPIREVSESDTPPSADLGPSPVSLLECDRIQGSSVEQTGMKETERPNSFGFDPSPLDLEKANSGRLRLGPLPRQTPPPSGPLPAAPALGISSPLLRSPSPTADNSSGHHSHDRPQTPTSLGSTVPSIGENVTGRHPQPLSLNGHVHPHSLRGYPQSLAHRLEVGGALLAEALAWSSPRQILEPRQVDPQLMLLQEHSRYRLGVCPRKGPVVRLFMEVETERLSYPHNARSRVRLCPHHQ